MNGSNEERALERELRDLPAFDVTAQERMEEFAKIRADVKKAPRRWRRPSRGMLAGLSAAAVILLSVGLYQSGGLPFAGMQAENQHPERRVFRDESNLTQIEQKKVKTLLHMAYAFENFKTLTGTAVYEHSDTGRKVQEQLEFQIREGKEPASYVKATNPYGVESEYRSDGEYFQQEGEGVEEQVERIPAELMAYNRLPVMVEKEGDRFLSIKPPQDPAYTYVLGNAVAPLQRQLDMFTLSRWDYSGEAEVAGRDTQILYFSYGAVGGRGTSTQSQQFWVDKETGIVLKYENKLSNGQISERFEITSVKFNERVDEELFEIPEADKE